MIKFLTILYFFKETYLLSTESKKVAEKNIFKVL